MRNNDNIKDIIIFRIVNSLIACKLCKQPIHQVNAFKIGIIIRIY